MPMFLYQEADMPMFLYQEADMPMFLYQEADMPMFLYQVLISLIRDFFHQIKWAM